MLHGYGGAKSSMPSSRQGWTILAAALLGTNTKPPLWTQDGFRPVIGTTVDSRVTPVPLSSKEESLLLSRWWPAREESLLKCLDTFLHGVDMQQSSSQASVLRDLSPAAKSPQAILELLADLAYPMWTLSAQPDKHSSILEALICCAFTIDQVAACLVACFLLDFLAMSGTLQLGYGFNKEVRAERTLRIAYRIPAGHLSVLFFSPLPRAPLQL